jgi:hypothetical protein
MEKTYEGTLFTIISITVITNDQLERLLASALDSFAKDIDYKTNPEVRLSSCTWYTPDFIIGNRLIEPSGNALSATLRYCGPPIN